MFTKRHFLTSAALVVAAMFIVDAASADCYRSLKTGNWSAVGMGSTWEYDADCDGTYEDSEPADPPGAGDTVIIQSGHTVTVDSIVSTGAVTVNGTVTMSANFTVTSLTVSSTGIVTTNGNTLTVTASNGLTIDASGVINVNHASGKLLLSGGGNSQTINGTLNLTLSGATLEISSSATIDGTGFIDGDHDDALIEIAQGVTFTNKANIKGKLQITFAVGATTADFVNHADGSVEANKAGTLDINPNTHSAGGGAFKVTNASGTLKFSVDATSLTGAFTVSNGTLDIDAVVTTTGNLVQTGGTIDAAANPSKTFTAG